MSDTYKKNIIIPFLDWIVFFEQIYYLKVDKKFY